MYCMKCGAKFEGNFCPNCGEAAYIAPSVSSVEMTSRLSGGAGSLSGTNGTDGTDGSVGTFGTGGSVGTFGTNGTGGSVGTFGTGGSVGTFGSIGAAPAPAAAKPASSGTRAPLIVLIILSVILAGLTAATFLAYRDTSASYIAQAQDDQGGKGRAGDAGDTYGPVLESALPSGEWRFVWETEDPELAGEDARGVEYTARHSYAGGSENVSVKFKVWKDLGIVQPTVYADGTALEDGVMDVVLDRMFAAHGGGKEAEAARDQLDRPLEDVVGAYHIDNARKGTAAGYSRPYGDLLSAALPSGDWAFSGAETVTYTAKSARDGGTETVQLSFAGDPPESAVLRSISIDGTELTEQEMQAAREIIFSAGERGQPAASNGTSLSAAMAERFICVYRDEVFDGFPDITHDDAFGTYFEGGQWSYAGGTVQYDAKNVYDSGDADDVSIRYTPDGEGGYTTDVYMNGGKLDSEEADLLLNDTVNYYIYSKEDELPDWCSGIYYGDDQQSTVEFWSPGYFEIYLYELTDIYDCLGYLHDGKVVFRGETDDGTVSGTLSHDGSDRLTLTITETSSEVLDTGKVMDFYPEQVQEEPEPEPPQVQENNNSGSNSSSSVNNSDPLIYFIEHSDTQYFSSDYFIGFNEDRCTLAMNGIYARSGRMFLNSDLQQYYLQFDWYYPLIPAAEFTEYYLNDYQMRNIDALLRYESYMGY